MLNPATNGLRTSTNMTGAGALAVMVIAGLTWFWPDKAAMLPPGTEVALALGFANWIGRKTGTRSKPGIF